MVGTPGQFAVSVASNHVVVCPQAEKRAGHFIMSSETMSMCERSAMVPYQGVSVNHIEVLPKEWGGTDASQTLYHVQRDHANV